MAIAQEHFETLAGRLEDESDVGTRTSKMRLTGLAALAYGFVGSLVVALIAALAALAYLLMTSRHEEPAALAAAIAVIVLTAAAFGALRIRAESPTGLWLDRKKYPQLFATIDEVQAAASAPRLHVILMTDKMDAAIVQRPRLGLFGWQKNHLIVGLPLMQLLSPDEFRAVLAHEFGLISRAGGRFGAWSYRTRANWSRLLEEFQQNGHRLDFLLRPFFGWLVPRFVACSFGQARRHEYAADRVAADVLGAMPMANALIRIQLKTQELERSYWPSIYAAATDEPEPSGAPYAELSRPVHRDWQPDAAIRLREALLLHGDTTDTRPSLNERLAALHVAPHLPDPPARSAADFFLAGSLASITEYFDSKWRRRIAIWWAERHTEARRSNRRLAAMRRKLPETMPDDELAALARLTEEIEGPKSAYPLYLMLAKRPSKPGGAWHAVGRLLLRSGNETGKRILDKLMQQDADAILPASEIIVPYLLSQGRKQEAAEYVARYQRIRSKLQHDQNERYRLRANDYYVPADLSSHSKTRIQQVLARHKAVGSAYIVRKQLPQDEAPLFVVGIVPSDRLMQASSPAADRELCEAIATQVKIPEDTLFVPLNARSSAFRKKLTSMQGARIYG